MKSVTHFRFGSGAVKSRLIRSGNGALVLSCFVNPLRRLIFRAISPWRRIDFATVFSETTQPSSRRSSTRRGEPCRPRCLTNMTFTARSRVSRRRSLVHTQIAGDLSDRLLGLFDDPHSPFTELPVVPHSLL